MYSRRTGLVLFLMFALSFVLTAAIALSSAEISPQPAEQYRYSVAPRGDDSPVMSEQIHTRVYHGPDGVRYESDTYRYQRVERVRIYTDAGGRFRAAVRETRADGEVNASVDSVWTDQGRVWVERRTGGKKKVKDFQLLIDQELAVDASLLLLLRRLPFDEGIERRLFLVDFTQRKVNAVVRHRGIESVSVPAGTFRCHRMEVEVEMLLIKPKLTFWLATEAPHFLVRHEGRRGPFTKVYETVLESTGDGEAQGSD